jgi:peptidoglycan/xylan/chitin deacetylase (PgdA/CDA1 family)
VSKTIALRTELQRLFKTLTANVHYEQRPDTFAYPYLVYELREMTYDYGKTTYQMEVNILDYGTSSSAVETLADTVQEALNKYHFINDKIQFVTYKGQRQSVLEDDKKVVRRRLLFEIQLHEMKGE